MKYNGPKVLKKKQEMGTDMMYYIQEKIDGSQLSFTIEDGKTIFACRGKPIIEDVIQFKKAVHMLKYMKDVFNPNYVYHGESVTSNKHNIITYNRMPLYNYIIYDIYDKTLGDYLGYKEMHEECDRIGYEHVPLLYVGHGEYYDITVDLIKKDRLESYLGGQIEGVVVKFPKRTQQKGCYKYVIDSFREVNEDVIVSNEQDYVMQLGSRFATEARFLKSVQHLQEQGYEVNKENMRRELDEDFDKEYKEIIKELLWSEFSHDIKKYAKEGYDKYCN